MVNASLLDPSITTRSPSIPLTIEVKSEEGNLEEGNTVVGEEPRIMEEAMDARSQNTISPLTFLPSPTTSLPHQTATELVAVPKLLSLQGGRLYRIAGDSKRRGTPQSLLFSNCSYEPLRTSSRSRDASVGEKPVRRRLLRLYEQRHSSQPRSVRICSRGCASHSEQSTSARRSSGSFLTDRWKWQSAFPTRTLTSIR